MEQETRKNRGTEFTDTEWASIKETATREGFRTRISWLRFVIQKAIKNSKRK